MSPRKPVQREKGEQANIVALARSLGGKEYVLGTRRSRGKACPTCRTFVPEDQGTRQTPGVADVLLFLPVKSWTKTGRPVGSRILLAVECKAPGGRMSDEQREFQSLCRLADIEHLVGGYDAFIAWLVERGFCKATQFPHYRQLGAASGAVGR